MSPLLSRVVQVAIGIVRVRITCFERPTRYDYLIERSSPLPFKHELGTVQLEERDGKTHVTWLSKGHIGIPLLGKLFFDPMFEKQGHKGFASLLKQIEER